MKLKRGYIAYFKYTRYHKDPYPLALVLYVAEKEEFDQVTKQTKKRELVHCLNIHYLSKDLTDELVNMIANVALKTLDARDMYQFYHDHMKKNLPNVIKSAYRTYYSDHISNISLVSRGFEASRGFIEALKQVNKKPTEQKIIHQVTKEIENVKESKKTPEEIEKEMSASQIYKNVEEYFNKIKSIVKPKTDFKKYTGLKK